jgi:chorismate mutase/prephenate dehydratase
MSEKAPEKPPEKPPEKRPENTEGTRPDLQAVREAIEGLDHRILDLLKRRMELVDRVVAAKLERAFPLRDPPREERILQRVRHAAVELGLDPHEIERLYRLVMEMSIARQQEHIRSLAETPLRVAYQGVEGSFSHLAAQRRYAGRKGGVLLTGYSTFRAAAEAVRDGTADLGLLPIENTTAGSINETYDLLAEGALTILGEVVSQIDHCLLALPGTRLEDVRRILSHPQALGQCQGFLESVPWAEARAEFDTAGSARKIQEEGDPTVAAIASGSAARVFGLEILRRGIQTQRGNYTRFVEVALEAAPCPPDAECKTSLMLVLRHEPGTLGEVLGRLGRRRVNLTKLESRPIPESPFKYRFYLDLEGHAASERVSAALEEMRALTVDLRVLGTYPRAAAVETVAELPQSGELAGE